ncbi:putative NUDIX family NTP pyrophosphohydrolase [Silvibacterium bohemicum]|uniref:Putative NUDIX family NTP pyrophosphohydrolase n=1 Tax=Silvibacterium bohemicum TaxID=1577686 RepID=A0A841JWH3_9BACT|nr:NUDIX domain-containing protein [Silvibacterium bohemicum]MBB6145753.1 putative NUDIX family NTP pyrophosphohydrolase [Silvibacterium bohemicum]
MPKLSAGLLMYRRSHDGIEVFLVHPGGPFWAQKDLGAWSIPKGEYLEGELPLQAAMREFREETGFEVDGEPFELGTIKQNSGKLVSVWAIEGDCDPASLVSNTCEIEWPPRSGRKMEIPEVDRGAWFDIDQARQHILQSQSPALDLLLHRIDARP